MRRLVAIFLVAFWPIQNLNPDNFFTSTNNSLQEALCTLGQFLGIGLFSELDEKNVYRPTKTEIKTLEALAQKENKQAIFVEGLPPPRYTQQAAHSQPSHKASAGTAGRTGYGKRAAGTVGRTGGCDGPIFVDLEIQNLLEQNKIIHVDEQNRLLIKKEDFSIYEAIVFAHENKLNLARHISLAKTEPVEMFRTLSDLTLDQLTKIKKSVDEFLYRCREKKFREKTLEIEICGKYVTTDEPHKHWHDRWKPKKMSALRNFAKSIAHRIDESYNVARVFSLQEKTKKFLKGKIDLTKIDERSNNEIEKNIRIEAIKHLNEIVTLNELFPEKTNIDNYTTLVIQSVDMAIDFKNKKEYKTSYLFLNFCADLIESARETVEWCVEEAQKIVGWFCKAATSITKIPIEGYARGVRNFGTSSHKMIDSFAKDPKETTQNLLKGILKLKETKPNYGKIALEKIKKLFNKAIKEPKEFLIEGIAKATEIAFHWLLFDMLVGKASVALVPLFSGLRILFSRAETALTELATPVLATPVLAVVDETGVAALDRSIAARSIAGNTNLACRFFSGLSRGAKKNLSFMLEEAALEAKRSLSAEEAEQILCEYDEYVLNTDGISWESIEHIGPGNFEKTSHRLRGGSHSYSGLKKSKHSHKFPTKKWGNGVCEGRLPKDCVLKNRYKTWFPKEWCGMRFLKNMKKARDATLRWGKLRRGRLEHKFLLDGIPVKCLVDSVTKELITCFPIKTL